MGICGILGLSKTLVFVTIIPLSRGALSFTESIASNSSCKLDVATLSDASLLDSDSS